MKQNRTWILLADGARARIIRQLKADSESGERPEDLTYEFQKEQLREIMSDRPGRSYSSHDARRSAMEYHSDPVREREKDFADQLLAELERHQAAGQFDRLAIIAEPRMLGLIRDRISKQLQALVIAEIDKDLTKLPRTELVGAIVELGVYGLRAEHPSNG